MIAELDDELRVLRARVSGHDQRCRSVHLAAANRIGGGWPALLRGYLAVLHYTDHTIADLEDANLLYLQTFQSVIADGRVSSKELRKLVAACNQVQRALGQVYAQAGQVQMNARWRRPWASRSGRSACRNSVWSRSTRTTSMPG